eukprot:NODE_3570_length_355_cov_100.032680_g2900_i0.p1 GENE.NODE_3570_length_355_cov_100.032680_g2900_i0~~NODE_3570_length_355_cov_100.032680_g2900_i0.p1  ORF type:complete len:69 (-),score=7.59 NODE_3570_length_355_cov_100.032680_g2900_i0:116-322(-)
MGAFTGTASVGLQSQSLTFKAAPSLRFKTDNTSVTAIAVSVSGDAVGGLRKVVKFLNCTDHITASSSL